MRRSASPACSGGRLVHRRRCAWALVAVAPEKAHPFCIPASYHQEEDGGVWIAHEFVMEQAQPHEYVITSLIASRNILCLSSRHFGQRTWRPARPLPLQLAANR
jgi:hypothetical protein